MTEAHPPLERPGGLFVASQELALYELTPEHLPRILELIERPRLAHGSRRRMLVVLAEHLGSGRILSTDQRDFGAYRWKNRRPFQNLIGE